METVFEVEVEDVFSNENSLNLRQNRWGNNLTLIYISITYKIYLM